jgi:hypothetical protein
MSRKKKISNNKNKILKKRSPKRTIILEVLILDKEMHTPKASNRAEISFKIQLHL